MNHSKVGIDDLANKIMQFRKTCKSYGANNVAILSILIRCEWSDRERE